MSYATLAIIQDRYGSSHVRPQTAGGYDAIVASFGSDVVSYWKFENDGVDQKGVANAAINGAPELGVPSIVKPDRISEGAATDGQVIAWPGSIGEYAQVAFNAAHHTLEGTIVVSFQCDSLNEASTLLASNNNPSQPGELVIQVNTNGSPQANLRNAAGTPITLMGLAGDVVLNRAYTIIVKHGTAGFSMALYNDALALVRRATNPLNTGQALGLSPIRFGAWHNDTGHHDGPYGRVVWMNRRITDAEEVQLARPRTVAHGVAPGDYDDTPITSRNPKLYLKLQEASGVPVDTAGAGYAGAITIQGGTPVAYQIETQKGTGIRLGTSAYIQAAHHSVFETSGANGPFGSGGIYGANGHIESEVTFSIHCAFPVAPQDNWVIFSKDDNDADFLPGVSLRVMENGSVELWVREHKYRVPVRMITEAGLITQGTEHHFTVSLGYEGAWFTVDGRQAELGFKNNLAWWGLDHRHNGNEANQKAVSVRVTNTSAIRLGRTGNQSSSADIVVTKFAVFYDGGTRITRGQVKTGLNLAACQSLAGASGAALPDPRFTAVAPRTAATGTNTIQAHIDACNAGGGGTVILNGNYTQSVDLVLKSRVRLTTTSSATVTFSGRAMLTTPSPSMLSAAALAAGGVLSSGASTYNVSNTLSNDAIFLIAMASVNTGTSTAPVWPNALGSMYLASGQVAHTPASTFTDLIPIASRTGTSITFARAPYFSYPTTNRGCTTAITNPTVDIAADGNITFTKVGVTFDGTTVDRVAMIRGARRARFNNITIAQTGGDNVIDCMGAHFAGCTEVRLNGCDISTQSADMPAADKASGDDTTVNTHPYALEMEASSHYDIFDHTGYGDEWHAIDNSTGNPNAEWGFAGSAGGTLWGGQLGDMRKLTCSNNEDQWGNNFPAITHIAWRIRCIDLLSPSGGGISVDGWGHEFEYCEFASGGRPTQIAHSRGVGGSYFWHSDFNNNLGNWANGSRGYGKNSYGDLHHTDATPTSTFSYPPDAGGNSFIDVDISTRSGAQWPPASPLP